MRCWGELVMGAIFRICGNKSQPGLQLDEKLATHLKSREFTFKDCRCRIGKWANHTYNC